MVCKSLCDKTACPGRLPLPTPNVDHLPLLHRSLLSHLGLLHVLENIRCDLPLCTPPPGGCRAHSHSLFAQVSPSRRSLPRALLPPHGSCFFLSIQLSASHTLYWGKESAQGCIPQRLLGRPDEALGGGNQGGRLWQFAHPRPLSLLQRGLAPRSKGKARAELRPARRQASG